MRRYIRVHSGLKINPVGLDSGLISSGLSQVGFIFYLFIYACRVQVISDSSRFGSGTHFRTREDYAKNNKIRAGLGSVHHLLIGC